MRTNSDRHIIAALALARELTILADQGDGDRPDDGCAVLYGVLRDCAYKIRAEAERELGEHKVRGIRHNRED